MDVLGYVVDPLRHLVSSIVEPVSMFVDKHRFAVVRSIVGIGSDVVPLRMVNLGHEPCIVHKKNLTVSCELVRGISGSSVCVTDRLNPGNANSIQDNLQKIYVACLHTLTGEQGEAFQNY